MDPVTKLNIVLAASLICIVSVCVATYRSTFPKDQKVAVYLISVLAPVFGLVVFLIIRWKQLRHGRQNA